MAVLHDCSRFRVLHTGRPGKFYGMWMENPYGIDHVFLENRQQENARDHVPSAP